MTETQSIIAAFFRETLKIEVRSVDENLIEQGLIDSLALFELIHFLEQRFDVIIDLTEFDLVQVSSIGAIGRLVDAHANPSERPSG